jgi:hypothetical protein
MSTISTFSKPGMFAKTMKFGPQYQRITTQIHPIFVTPMRFLTTVREFNTHEGQPNYCHRKTSHIKIIEERSG